MRIVVNGLAASQGGAMSILKSFYNYLVETEERTEDEWIFLLNSKHVEDRKNIKVIVLENVKKSWFNRLNFDLWSGKSIVSEMEPDITFSLQNTLIFGLDCPQVLYVHQSIPFQTVKNFSFFKPEERTLAVYQHLVGRLIKKSIVEADKTIVQSEWMRQAVLKETKISPIKICTVPPPNQDIEKYKHKTDFDNKSFFYPAISAIYKNHKCIFSACEILNQQGIDDFDVSLTINSRENWNNITALGKIPYESVMEKYNSSVLLFPSYIETVGLPLMEARQMGTLILAADTPFAKEVLHEYENAYFFDPFNPTELTELMRKVMTGEIIKQDVFRETKQDSSWRNVVETIKESKTTAV